MKKVFKQKQLEVVIENELIENYFSSLTSKKSYISGFDEIERKITNAVVNSKNVISLLDKYQKRSNLKSIEIEKMTGIKDFGSFKKSETFNKNNLYLVSICLQLNYTEAKDLFNYASVLLNPKTSVPDCVFCFYIKNYRKLSNPELNIEEFKACLMYGNDYFSKKVKGGINRWKI